MQERYIKDNYFLRSTCIINRIVHFYNKLNENVSFNLNNASNLNNTLFSLIKIYRNKYTEQNECFNFDFSHYTDFS